MTDAYIVLMNHHVSEKHECYVINLPCHSFQAVTSLSGSDLKNANSVSPNVSLIPLGGKILLTCTPNIFSNDETWTHLRHTGISGRKYASGIFYLLQSHRKLEGLHIYCIQLLESP